MSDEIGEWGSATAASDLPPETRASKKAKEAKVAKIKAKNLANLEKAGKKRGKKPAAQGAKRPRPSPAGEQQRKRSIQLRTGAQRVRNTNPGAAAEMDDQAAKIDELAARLDELTAQANAGAQLPGAPPPAEAAAELSRLLELAALDPLAAAEEAGLYEDAEGGDGYVVDGGATLPWLPGADGTSFAFRRGVLDIATATGFPADELWGVMGLESKFDPATTNPQGGATGLIQWMPQWSPVPSSELRAMSREQQLPLVGKFFARNRWRVPGDAYVATAWPAALGKPDDYVIARKGEVDPVLKADVYAVNRGLDTNGDGTITAGDVRQKLLRAIGGTRRIDTDGEDPPAAQPGRTWRRIVGGLVAGAAGAGLLWLSTRRGGR